MHAQPDMLRRVPAGAAPAGAHPPPGAYPPHALRATVRFGFADMLFLIVAVPALDRLGIAELLAFLGGALWAVPPEEIPATLRELFRRRVAVRSCATCAIGISPHEIRVGATAQGQLRLIGAIERVIR
jgi:hypothetical protein